MGTNLRELEEIKNKGFRVLKEHLSPAELVQFLQMLGVGTGDYIKEKYENDEDITIEDFANFACEAGQVIMKIKTILKKRVVFSLG